MEKIKKIIPLNRVEGDLEIHLELDGDHVVREARSVGIMYRGIENLMIGRGPLDSLVITPRICGICTTAHLNAAARSLDMAYQAKVPDNAQRLRNITLLVEHMQNDLRHAFLLFMADFADPRYADQPLYGEALRRYQVLKGESVIHTIRETKKVVEIIAILGGQWPHSSFMVPGGVVSVPTAYDIAQCRQVLRHFRRWYETSVLGCSLERWAAVCCWHDVEVWLDENPSHMHSDLGFFIRFALAAGLDRIGRGYDRFISCGGPPLPADTQVKGLDDSGQLWPAGLFTPAGVEPFDTQKIGEDISCAYYKGQPGICHPFEGSTQPDTEGSEGCAYSWAKAPRYDGHPAETGPLAEMLLAGEPLFVEWVRIRGANVFIREMARLVRPAALLPAVDQWLAEMVRCDGSYFCDYLKSPSTRGFGLIPAPRGILGHWVIIEDGVIANYQVITPTAWNASPRDARGLRGPWEEAMVGTPVRNPERPVEVEQIVRSFDPCLVCTVHAVRLDLQGCD